MSRDRALAAVLAGAALARREIEVGLDLVAIGDMGIGNTTASSTAGARWTAGTD